MAGYFEFLREYKNIYENATYTEKLQESASNRLELETLENQMRKTVESIVNKLIKMNGIVLEDTTDLRSKIDYLYENQIIDLSSKDNLHTIRMAGNNGSHDQGTIDARREERLFNEQQERDINAYKRLYVECCRFVNEYSKEADASRCINVDTKGDYYSYPKVTQNNTNISSGYSTPTGVNHKAPGAGKVFLIIVIIVAIIFMGYKLAMMAQIAKEMEERREYGQQIIQEVEQGFENNQKYYEEMKKQYEE